MTGVFIFLLAAGAVFFLHDRCSREFHEECYCRMVQAGVTRDGECRGIVPDGSLMYYLSQCEDCPYRRAEKTDE